MENLQRVYLEQNLLLAKTIVIKSEATADSINDDLILKYGDGAVDLNFPKTWKYYLNITGEYHSTNETMVVTSLDTLEQIVFNKENLLTHTSTKEAYAYGSRYYYNLLDQYPSQESLILGILYPCDISEAVDKDDHSVLSYPEHLVEIQELTLIAELEESIKRYYARWDIDAFNIANDLYRAAQLGVFYLTLVPKLLNLRLKRCHSNETHSFHIREYLASHGRLDKYMPYMTLEQQLFLYRNLNWLDRNAGRVNTFKLLVEKLFTDRHIPISEYSVRQLSMFTETNYPVIRVRKKPINTQYNVPEKDYFTLEELTNKEHMLAPGNPKYLEEHLAGMEHMMQISPSSVTQTKDLESSMIDSSDALPDPLEVVLTRQWGYMAAKGYYNTIINFKDPVTFEARSLTAKDAFIYMQYIATKADGIDVKVVQDFLACKYRRIIKPTKAELLSLVNNKYYNYNNIVDDLLSKHITIQTCNSITAFYKTNRAIYEQCKYDWYLTSYIDDVWARGEVENITQAFYAMERVSFYDAPIGIDRWLTERNLPKYNYTKSQAQELVSNIFLTGSGMKYDATKTLKEIQKAMAAVFKQLSSYTIQLIFDTNDGKVIPLNWAALRFGNQRGEASIEKKIFSRLEVVDVWTTITDTEYLDITDTNPLAELKLSYENKVELKHALDLTEDIHHYPTVKVLNQPLNMYVKTRGNGDISSDDEKALVAYIDDRATLPRYGYFIGFNSTTFIELRLDTNMYIDNGLDSIVLNRGLSISIEEDLPIDFNTLSLDDKLALRTVF